MRDHHRLRLCVRALATAILAAVLLSPAASASAVTADDASRAAPAAPAAAWTRDGVDDFTFDSFDARYALGRDADRASTLRVVETLVARFPQSDQNHGIERAIPREYAGSDLGLQISSVTDESGTPLSYTLSDDGDFLVIRIGDADRYVHGRQGYVIEYTMRDVVRSFDDTGVQEFFWDVNGTGSAQPYARVTAELTLAPELRGSLSGEAACYVGTYGATTQCPLELSDVGASASATEVGPFATVTWSIGFLPDTFRTPPLPSDSWIVRLIPWVLVGVALACLIVVLWLRLRVFRDARGRGIVVPQYEGYPELGVMEAALLLDREDRGLPAQFVQLVVTRAARLIDRGAEEKARYRLELDDASVLERDDAIAVATIFGSTKAGTTVTLDTADRKLGDRIESLRAKVRTEVSTRYRVTPRSPWTTVVRIALFVNGLAAIVVAFWAADAEAGTGLLIWQTIAVLVGGILIFGYAGAPAVLTREGALAREHLDGIRDYLELAEADRIRVLQSPEGAERTPVDTGDREAVVRLNEGLLPYAILFGIEASWQRELGTMYATTPSELAQTFTGTSLSSFAAGYTAASFATTPPVTSASSWSSSGGSSFSGGSGGGGFAGGGGGGGGAGGW
ncbi:MAG: DUF2207 domain-containing protein [Leifsonia xyli]|nr:MAG: DUF2207 domain-containing protein [Leifsonia xyli]